MSTKGIRTGWKLALKIIDSDLIYYSVLKLQVFSYADRKL